ncbi:FG-GAP repeat protein [Streptomyces poriticola]|uniref:FG-GAP repeat protein n=1 Tax=Streptomyces poriticola TaxID=3120506 RepID=UPI002FCE627F
MPGNTVAERAGAGAVFVADGTSTGPASSSVPTGREAPASDAPEADDGFGRSVTSGDFDRDGFADLAVTASAEAIGDTRSTGLPSVHHGRSAGIHGAVDETASGR